MASASKGISRKPTYYTTDRPGRPDKKEDYEVVKKRIQRNRLLRYMAYHIDQMDGGLEKVLTSADEHVSFKRKGKAHEQQAALDLIYPGKGQKYHEAKYNNIRDYLANTPLGKQMAARGVAFGGEAHSVKDIGGMHIHLEAYKAIPGGEGGRLMKDKSFYKKGGEFKWPKGLKIPDVGGLDFTPPGTKNNTIFDKKAKEEPDWRTANPETADSQQQID